MYCFCQIVISDITFNGYVVLVSFLFFLNTLEYDLASDAMSLMIYWIGQHITRFVNGLSA